MSGFKKSEIRLCVIIAASYFLFWNLVVVIQSGGKLKEILSGYDRLVLLILLVTVLNFWIHLFFVPFCRQKKQKIYYYIFFTIGTLVFLTFGLSVWYKLAYSLGLIKKIDSLFTVDVLVRNFLIQLFGVVYFGAIKFLVDAYKWESKNKNLLIERKTAELNFLKAQTNPHFLFNTLNNIYSLSRLKSDKAPESLLRLSDMLRYMLYETQIEQVPIEKEIKIINEYIELEKLRYDNTLKVTFVYSIDNLLQDVPPLLMLPLVENAFKHGTSETKVNPFIQIKLSLDNFVLQLEVENSSGEYSGADPIKEGIGLKNLRRQLELLFGDYDLAITYFPPAKKSDLGLLLGEYSLDDKNRGNYFHSKLAINLKSYAKT